MMHGMGIYTIKGKEVHGYWKEDEFVTEINPSYIFCSSK